MKVLIIIIIILSGTSSSLLIFAPLDIISYATYRDVVIIPSVIAIFAIGILSRNKFPRITKRIFVGMSAGAVASFALEICIAIILIHDPNIIQVINSCSVNEI